MTEITTSTASRRRPAMIAAAAVIAAVTLAGGIALLTTRGGDDLPRLQLGTTATGAMAASGDEGRAEADDMAGMGMMAWVRYVAGDDLPDLGGSAPVYRLRGGDDDLRSIAEHLGLDGSITDGDGDQRSIVDGDASVNGYGASWWYTSGRPYPGGDGIDPDRPVECELAGGSDPAEIGCIEPTPLPEPERPADLPSQAEAEQIVRELAAAAGVDLTGARVTSHDGIVTWGVTIDLALDGTPIPGYSVYGTVMAGGEVLDAGGVMGGLERVGDYPLETTRDAIDRMNDQSSGSDQGTTGHQGVIEPMPEEPAAQTDPAPDAGVTGGGVSGDPGEARTEPAPDEMTILPIGDEGEPIVVTLVRARLAHTLLGNVDGTETYLVPVYLMDGESDRGDEWTDVLAIAVRSELLGV